MIRPAIGLDEMTCLPDTTEGRDARVLIAGYAEMLASAARSHEPLARLCEIKEDIERALNRALSVTIRHSQRGN